MNKRGDRDSELRPIVNPHDVSGTHTSEEAAEDATYYPAMKEPRQVFKVPSEVLVEHHARQHMNRFPGEAPGSVRVGTDDYRVGCVAYHVSDPARDRAACEL
jgi:hypothetical protein